MSLYLGTNLIAPNQPNSANQSLSNINSTAQENIVDLLYPVGSIYIGTTAECPLAAIKGTWTLQSSAIVTSVDTSVPVKGTGKSLGMTDGTNNFGTSQSLEAAAASARAYGPSASAYGANVGGSGYTRSSGNNRAAVGVTKDATKSGIVGTVTRSTLSVNIWKRTA